MTFAPVVFVPGFMCDARLFAPVAQRLEERGCKTQTAALTGRASIAGLAADVLAAAPPRFALVGLSMGGIVAFEILRQAPERVSHLALLNTTPAADAAQLQRKAHLRRIARGEIRTVLMELKPRYLAEANRRPELLALVVAMGEALGPEVFVRQTIALMLRSSSRPTLPHITCPTLVLAGAEDHVCPVSLHQEMAETIPGARLLVIPGVGHLSALEAPEAVAEALWALIARTQARFQVVEGLR